MENKQTAVEWLANKINNNSWNYMTIRERKKIIQQAIEMEKQQIMDAYERGWDMGALDIDCNSEKYYSETFKK